MKLLKLFIISIFVLSSFASTTWAVKAAFMDAIMCCNNLYKEKNLDQFKKAFQEMQTGDKDGIYQLQKGVDNPIPMENMIFKGSSGNKSVELVKKDNESKMEFKQDLDTMYVKAKNGQKNVEIASMEFKLGDVGNTTVNWRSAGSTSVDFEIKSHSIKEALELNLNLGTFTFVHGDDIMVSLKTNSLDDKQAVLTDLFNDSKSYDLSGDDVTQIKAFVENFRDFQ